MSFGKRRAPMKRSAMAPRQPAKGAGGLRPLKITKRKPRTKSERERIYGTDEHQRWLRAMPCLGCARMGSEDRPHHLHHVANGGTGRKANAERQVPLCWACHQWLHDHGPRSFEAAFSDMLCGRTLASWATTYADAWTKWEAA